MHAAKLFVEIAEAGRDADHRRVALVRCFGDFDGADQRGLEVLQTALCLAALGQVEQA